MSRPVEHEITSDGTSVWINDEQGMCIGRYGRLGTDVHNDVAAQILGEGQCLDCRRHTGDLAVDWDYFKASMLQHYGIAVGDEHKPERTNAAWK